MKIGEFAKLFHVNKETVRFYTNKKLLTPVKSGPYYDYDRNCIHEMTSILKLKAMDFHLEEIAKYLSFLRLSTKNKLPMKDELVKLFKHKLEDLNRKKHQLETAQKELNQRLEEILAIEDYSEGTETEIGFPLDYLSKLVCPVCHEPLSLMNGEISMNYLMEGQFHCKCGYKAEVKDGVLVLEGAIFDKSYETNSKRSDTEEMLPPDYISAVSASSRWLQDKLLKEDFEGKIIFDHSTNDGLMSNQLIDLLLDKCQKFTYIGLDSHYYLIKNFKKAFSMNAVKPKAIFMAGKVEQIPFNRESFDFVACSASLQSYGIFYKEMPVEKILTYLKNGGKWFGNFFCVDDKKRVSENYQDIAKIFCCRDLKEVFSGFNKHSFIDIGQITEKGELSFYFKDDAKVRFYVFAGEK